MDKNQEEYEQNPLTSEQLADEIRKVYTEKITAIKKAEPKESYTAEGAKVWAEFVRESFQSVDENETSISWESYEKAKELTSGKKFIFCVKTFAEIDDNGNGLVDLGEAKNHVNWKKVGCFPTLFDFKLDF